MQIPLTMMLVLSSCLAIGEGEEDKEQHKLSAVAPLVGDWEGRGELPGSQSLVVPELVYEWTLDKRVISFHSVTNLPDGTTLQKRAGTIFWDPADKKVKMWVTDSTGGNIQATLTGVKDSELAWEADAVLPDGRRVAFPFTITIQGDAKHIVRRGEATFEMQRKKAAAADSQ